MPRFNLYHLVYIIENASYKTEKKLIDVLNDMFTDIGLCKDKDNYTTTLKARLQTCNTAL